MSGMQRCEQVGHSRLQKVIRRRDGGRAQICCRCSAELAVWDDDDAPLGPMAPISANESQRTATKQANDSAMVEWATEIKVRAERRAGELLRDMEKHEGGRPPKTSVDWEPVSPPTLESLGIDKKQSSRWQKLAAIPADKFEKARRRSCRRKPPKP